MAHEVDTERQLSISDEKPTHREFERAARVEDLPDPDAGKSEEERAEIVSIPRSQEANPPRLTYSSM
jgi:hypothetical protein